MHEQINLFQEVKMKRDNCIVVLYDNNVRYNTKLEGYMAFMWYINELGAISFEVEK